ncbi:MAG TPA: cysteine desulfurase family protein [Candidatus Melainabacteria bacterium]|jgi:cysteine desulfurase|nr:cysteine desulfurase family protein [Candidatus Melainabacteria bacterium]
MPKIYLDNSATTPVTEEVFEAALPYLRDAFGNPGSIHNLGQQSRQAINKARKQVADLIGAKPHEIYFTPSGTYSNNASILGRALYVEEHGLGRHIITSSIEHSSALGPAKHLLSRGWKVDILEVDSQGFVSVDQIRNLITAETSIISIMWANNEVGTIQPIEEIAELARAHGIFFHTDAVQAAGKLKIDVARTQVDTLSITGHKLHSPKGIGALYVREGVEILPIVYGGGQEKGLFPGTESVANIVALGAAAASALFEYASNYEHLRFIQKVFVERFSEIENVTLTGAIDPEKRIPGHVSVIVAGAIGEDLVNSASAQGIFISSVSACSSGHPSHVLKQLGYSQEEGIGSIRISASSLNSLEECQYAAEILAGIFAGQGVVEPAESLNVLSLPSNPSTVVDINRRHRVHADKLSRRARNNH